MTEQTSIQLNDDMQKAKCVHVYKSDGDYDEHLLEELSVFFNSTFDNFYEPLSHIAEELNLYDSPQLKSNPKPCNFYTYFDFQNLENSSRNISDEPYEYTISKKAFDIFLKENIDNPKYKDKFVAFVHGKYQGVDDQQMPLVLKMREKFGQVHMHVGAITKKEIFYRIG